MTRRDDVSVEAEFRRGSPRVAYHPPVLSKSSLEAFLRFNRDDGWAIASHIALSILMAVFPFLIVVTALAGFIGSVNLADEVARLMFAAWPHQVAGPIAGEIHNVLTTTRGGVLTLGAVFAVYFASSGIESLRIGLNRAYGLREERSFWLLRLESIGYVLVSAIALLALAFLVVLWPLIFKAAVGYAPWIEPLQSHLQFRTLRHRRHGARDRARYSAYVVAGRTAAASAAYGRESWRRWCCGSPAVSLSATTSRISPTPT